MHGTVQLFQAKFVLHGDHEHSQRFAGAIAHEGDADDSITPALGENLYETPVTRVQLSQSQILKMYQRDLVFSLGSLSLCLRDADHRNFRRCKRRYGHNSIADNDAPQA